MNKKRNGGGGEIRTHGRVAPTTIFKTVAFNRSATPPGLLIITETKKIIHWFNIIDNCKIEIL